MRAKLLSMKQYVLLWNNRNFSTKNSKTIYNSFYLTGGNADYDQWGLGMMIFNRKLICSKLNDSPQTNVH